MTNFFDLCRLILSFFFGFVLIFSSYFYLDRNSKLHVVDVSTVFDCAHSSTTSSAITSKRTIATKATKRREKPSKHSNNETNRIGNNTKQTLPKNAKSNGTPTNGTSESRNVDSAPPPTDNVSLNDEKTGPKIDPNVWTQVIQIVHDSQNAVVMAVILVFIYIFCYDRNVRS